MGNAPIVVPPSHDLEAVTQLEEQLLDLPVTPPSSPRNLPVHLTLEPIEEAQDEEDARTYADVADPTSQEQEGDEQGLISLIASLLAPESDQDCSPSPEVRQEAWPSPPTLATDPWPPMEQEEEEEPVTDSSQLSGVVPLNDGEPHWVLYDQCIHNHPVFIPMPPSADNPGAQFDLAKYIHLMVDERTGEPWIQAKGSIDGLVSAVLAYAAPHQYVHNPRVSDNDLGIFTEPFCLHPGINYALSRLGDLGILGDVHHLRSSGAINQELIRQCNLLDEWKKLLERDEMAWEAGRACFDNEQSKIKD
jgi:hypothetical protein